jgi:enoyl-CoA hydratase/carnithine racemase
VNRALAPEALWPFVDRLARRIASFPPHAVAEAKASVLRAEQAVAQHLLDEAAGFNRTLAGAGTREAMERFLASGGQTPAGEGRLGQLCAELGTVPS